MRLIYPPLRPQCKRFFRRADGRIGILEKLRDQAKSSKFQTPSSKEAPGPKHQTPSSKLQRSSKLEARSEGRGLELGTWDFFGVWSLVFGVSIPGFLWSLGFGAWYFAQRRLDFFRLPRHFC